MTEIEGLGNQYVMGVRLKWDAFPGGFGPCDRLVNTDQAIPQRHQALYPNPTYGETFVEGKAVLQSWRVTDLAGEIVMVSGSKHQSTTGLDISFLPKGIYFIELQDKAGYRRVEKVVKM